jgi:phage-related minor tail protein
MADRIKGITIEIGGDTTALSKALSGVNKEISTTQKQLRDVERLLKLDPGNVTLLEQKQRLLADSVEQTKQKLDSLKSAEKQVQQQFAQGKVSQAQYDALQREIVATEAELRKAEKAAAETADSVKKIDEKPLEKLADAAAETADSVQKIDEKPVEELADAAQDAEKALDKAGEKAQELASKISKTAGKVSKTFKPATKAAVGLVTAVYATVPATEELRSDLSKLDANARDNAVSVDAAREAWRAFAIQSGETDSAVEATSNLLQAGFTESNLQKAVEGLAGAAQRFPDTLKVESLADSLQETLATGKATGAFGELLDRLGVGAENFSEQLAQCTTDAEKQNLALEALSKAGLNDTYNAWAKNNEEMLANQDANLRFQEATASLAEAVLPLVTTITEKLAVLLQWFASLDPAVQASIGVIVGLIAAISPIAGIISGISTALAFLAANPIVLVIAGIVALIAVLVLIVTKGEEIKAWLAGFNEWLQGVFATDWTEIFGPVLGNVLNGFFSLLKGIWDGVYQVLNGVIDFIQGIFTGNWEQAWSGVQEIVSGVWDTITGIITGACDLIEGILLGLDSWLQGVFKTDWTEIFGPGLGDIINAFMKNVENTWNAIKQIFQGVIDFVKGVFTGNWKQAWQGVVNIFGGLFNSLINMVKAPLNGIIGLLNGAVGAINSLIGGLNSISFTMPKWLGGGHFGLSIPYIPNIPYLAKGGILSQGSAIVGEAGPELLTMMGNRAMVQPLTSNTTNQTDLGGVNITVYGAPGQDVRALADIIMDEMQNATERKAAVFGA